MRVWDVPVEKLCNKHLLGQHNEIHGIWSIITNNKEGYKNHPEVKRWRNFLGGLFLKHEQTAREMTRRGMNHQSPLSSQQTRIPTVAILPRPITALKEQYQLLKEKHS